MTSDRLRFRDIRRTSAFRLTTLLGATFAAGVLALLGLVYVMTARELTARSDRILHADAAQLLAAPAAELPRRVEAEAARGNGLAFVALFSGSGERIAGNIDPGPRVVPDRPVERLNAGAPVRLIAVPTAAGESIVVGRDVSQIRYLRSRILVILATSGMLILGGVAIAGTLLALRPLRRVRDLERAAREIASGRFEARMPLAGLGDELDQFAATVNVMVEELGRVIAQVKGVTDAVAHDLRTPLARVRALLHRSVRTADADPRWRGVADAAMQDLDAVLARFAALLRIAEIETGARRSEFAAVDLAAIAADVHALYEPLAEDRGMTLHLEAPAPILIEADRQLLIEAVSNLVDNAIKFARGTVIVTVVAREGGAILVGDDGAGIAPGERDAVLRRFHRGPNAEGLPGMGLGLSIVTAIAHLHGLELRLEDNGPGLLASLIAPAR